MVDQITADEFADRIDAGEDLTIIDTRPKESFESWHVDGAENVPYDPREGLSEADVDRVREITTGGQIVTICGKGLTSAPFAFELDTLGYEDVTVVKGGMEDWSTIYETVEIPTEPEDLVVRQLQRRGKGCLGYVVGCLATGEAIVVDVTRQHQVSELAAEEAGLTISGVVDTHVHADHISGGPRLAKTLGVPYYLGAGASERDVRHEYEPITDGDVISLGTIQMRAIAAPGHTSEMMNYVVNDRYVLTGDTLFVDSVGRTELQYGDAEARTGAEQLYDTIHDRLLSLPSRTWVLPGHVGVTADGHFEGGDPGAPITGRLGDLRADVELLGLEKEAFVERLVSTLPEKPPNYETIIAINTGRERVQSETEATELELGPNNCAA
jgi:glyoxylase-like metal-dependent hydrolase (beta-lactamase superfamily II)